MYENNPGLPAEVLAELRSMYDAGRDDIAAILALGMAHLEEQVHQAASRPLWGVMKNYRTFRRCTIRTKEMGMSDWTRNNHPTAETTKGVVIANFSSPHLFLFDDGTKLAPCGEALVFDGALEAVEETSPGPKGVTDICIDFHMTDKIRELLDWLHHDCVVDIVLVPRVLMDAIKRNSWSLKKYNKCRTIRMKDRLNKVAYHDRFCR
jgi:hypothetical protein